MARKPMPPVDASTVPDDAIRAAIKALWAGEAQPHQQRAALDWIIREACMVNRQSYRADVDGGTGAAAFAEGRRFVGLELQAIIVAAIKAKGTT